MTIELNQKNQTENQLERVARNVLHVKRDRSQLKSIHNHQAMNINRAEKLEIRKTWNYNEIRNHWKCINLAYSMAFSADKIFLHAVNIFLQSLEYLFIYFNAFCISFTVGLRQTVLKF